jgi:hypothetical protein
LISHFRREPVCSSWVFAERNFSGDSGQRNRTQKCGDSLCHPPGFVLTHLTLGVDPALLGPQMQHKNAVRNHRPVIEIVCHTSLAVLHPPNPNWATCRRGLRRFRSQVLYKCDLRTLPFLRRLAVSYCSHLRAVTHSVSVMFAFYSSGQSTLPGAHASGEAARFGHTLTQSTMVGARVPVQKGEWSARGCLL